MVGGQSGEVAGAQDVRFIQQDRSDDDVAAKSPDVVCASVLAQCGIRVVPKLGEIFFQAVQHQMLAFGSPIEVGILVDGPLINPRNEPSLLNEPRRDIQVLQTELEPSAAADQ